MILKIKPLSLFFALFCLSGCFFESKISRINPEPSASTTPTTNDYKTSFFEAVSGASKYEATTSRGYRVRQSIGFVLGKQVYNSNGNHKVYMYSTGKISAGEIGQ